MLGGNKNLKDGEKNLGIPVTDTFLSISYTKTSKLITALYMVTDIVDTSEPIRNKLRHLGAEIISDIHSIPVAACNKIAETVSFLNIASAMNLISEMNCNILKKEFLELNQSIKECTQARPSWLEEFLIREHPEENVNHGYNSLVNTDLSQKSIRHNKPSPYQGHTRIGVQKGSTLMKALSDKATSMSNSNVKDANDFQMLKIERRHNIIVAIKDKPEGATIKDIKVKINSMEHNGPECSEKTLQRELLSMTRDGVLNKTGEKRWSRYFIKN